MTRTIGGAAALAIPMALGLGGVAAAGTLDGSGNTAQTATVQNVSSSTQASASGSVHASNGNWYFHGWRNGRFFDHLDLTALLNIEGGSVYQSGGQWYYHGWKDGRFVNHFDLTGALHLGFTSSYDNGGDHNRGYQPYDDGGLLGGIL
jgi:hypothetical protein